MMKEFSLKNETPGGTQTIRLLVTDIDIDELLNCANEKHIRYLCEAGCTNYAKKWSCPPYSPEISTIISKNCFNKAIVICGFIQLSDMYYIKNPYQKVKAANMILKSKCESIARTIEKLTKGYSLLSGSCNLCKPCYKKSGLPCQKPLFMRYSLESTGINVGLLVQKYCEHQLLWYKKGEKQAYTSVVCAVLINDLNEIDYQSIFNTLIISSSN